MDNTTRPTSPLAVDSWLRELANQRDLAFIRESGMSEYAYLFGMATVKLAEAHQEIDRLTLERARRRVGGSR